MSPEIYFKSFQPLTEAETDGKRQCRCHNWVKSWAPAPALANKRKLRLRSTAHNQALRFNAYSFSSLVIHCHKNKTNLCIKAKPVRVEANAAVYFWLLCTFSVSARHIKLYLLQLWQAWFLWVDSNSWDTAVDRYTWVFLSFCQTIVLRLEKSW